MSHHVQWRSGNLVFSRESRVHDGQFKNLIVIQPIGEYPPRGSVEQLVHEHGMKDEFQPTWALQPVDLLSDAGLTQLVVVDPGGIVLEDILLEPFAAGEFLRLALDITTAVSQLHAREIVHNNLNPNHILVNCPSGGARLTGFGKSSRLPTDRNVSRGPETIPESLAYMSPEQTGRINRSLDTRSDLYALGVIFYRMLTGMLPFSAADPLEWIHSHVAKEAVSPLDLTPAVPPALSAIVMKLLAKTADDRYQSATGLEADLRRCLVALKAAGQTGDFFLGKDDLANSLIMPTRLYGRDDELRTLFDSFSRVANGGMPELVMVSGEPGVGKSAIVNELRQTLSPSQALFAVGKFDQYKRDIPYATLVQAFASLARALVGKSDSELAQWRHRFIDALGANARLLTDLIPDFRLVLGDQPPLPELDPQQDKLRFHATFKRMIGVFASAQHPLVLFIDDLHWLDPATLDILVDILTAPETRHVLMIAAYRGDEIDLNHRLFREIASIRSNGVRVQNIRLNPLSFTNVTELITDTLRRKSRDIVPLVKEVHDKTGGNPFFIAQFLHVLSDHRLLWFDHAANEWKWDIEEICDRQYTDNVANLMIRKLDSLSRATQVALQYLSCLGNVASIATLSLVLDDSPEQVASALEPAVYHDLVELQGENYKFTHDRVQEAAYAQLELGARERLHRKIGWLLVASTAANDSNDAIFDIANQLNNAVSVIDEPDECIRLARINLQAGQRAKSLAAYSTALDYFNRGALLLELSHEKATGDLTVALALGQGECELLTGNLIEAERRLTALPSTSFTVEQRSTVTCLLADINMARNDSPKAVELTLKFLRAVGINWSAHPDEDELKSEYEHVKSLIGCRTIETLIDLHPIRDSVALATVSVLGKLLPIALVTDRNLTALTACRAVAISLTYGHTDGSCNAYQYLCAMAARYFGDHELAARFGKLGYELVERRGLGDFAAHTYLAYAIGTLRWTEHVNASSAMLRKSWQAADRAGDFINALYAQQNLVSDQLFAGKSLIEVQQDAESSLAYARRFDFRHAIDNLGNQLALVNNLRGRTVAFGSFETETFSELETEQYLENSPGLAMSAFWYWVRKLQARYLAGNYDAAHTALINACRFEWAWPGPFEQAELHFYSALTHAALSDFPTAMRSHHLQETSRNFDLHSVWAELSPANFSARHSLVAAEIARLEGRDIQAMKLYEKSIREAQKSGFVHVEALANEHAAHFYAQGDFSFIANAYLRAAVHCFRRWGAEGKVKHFQKLHPDLFSLNESPLQSPQMMSAEQLDLATVIKLSQAVSSEIVLDKLIDTLMKTVLEQAGANRGVLILGREGNFEIFSEAKLVGNQTSVSLDRKEMTPHLVPATLVARAQRKLEVVISGDAIRDPDVSDDSYVRRRNSRSILCLPLLNQSRLAGIIYLENDFVAHLFTADRLALLRLVASQAAIAIDNAQLYLDLANREAKIRRLVEANIIGIMISDSCGNIVEANEAFLQIIGYERSDIERLKMSVRALQSKEPLGNNGSEHKLSDARTSVPYEAQYIRKDGQTVSVLIGSAVLDIASGESVSFVLDLSDRKRAEHYARESEKRLRDVQSELAHANRVATMGQLTASIAHEVNQPISATLINAEAALRWLNTPTPNLEEAKEALRRIANDGLRAGDVIGRIRAQLKRLPPQKENVSLGDSIADVLLLVNGQAEKHGVTIIVELADEAPLYAFCDRVQLQQVLLNLVLNAVEAISGEDVNFKRTVTISAALTENGFAGVRVADTGPGLTPEAVDRVFNPFVSSKPSGMGMGLSICRSIVESHGGQLSASLNKPRGTIFQFSVPVGTPNA